MIIKLNQRELQQMITETVKRVEERISPTEVFAGLIWHYCINSKDHLYNGEYYDYPSTFKYDDDGVNLLEVNYLQQRNQWTLFSTDYKHILRIAPLVLKWMDDTYFAYVASQQPANALKGVGRRKGRRGMRRRGQRPRRRAFAQPSSSILTTPLSQPQPSPRRRPQTQKQARTQERQREPGNNLGDNQQNGDDLNNIS